MHRVVGINRGPAGTLVSTRGDINGAGDSWQLTSGNLVGRLAFAVPNGGYALQLLPFLALGLFVVVLLTSGMRATSAVRPACC